MRPRISIRGCVRPLVRLSVCPSVRNAFVKKSEIGKSSWKKVEKSVYKVSKGV